jgi:hypothetical protein
MKLKYPFFQFPAAISRDSPSHHFDVSCSPFAELGGDLHTTPNGPDSAVNYENTEIADGENTYYYRPFGKLFFCVSLLFRVTVSRLL